MPTRIIRQLQKERESRERLKGVTYSKIELYNAPAKNERERGITRCRVYQIEYIVGLYIAPSGVHPLSVLNLRRAVVRPGALS